MIGTRWSSAPAFSSPMKAISSASEAPVACRILASDSVLGQRSLPSPVTRLLLLNVVGSRPARRASPEGDMPWRSANRSMARQMSA